MDHIGIDAHERGGQIYMLAEGGEVVEQRIRTEGERFAAAFGTRPRARSLIEASSRIRARGRSPRTAAKRWGALRTRRSLSSSASARMQSWRAVPPCGVDCGVASASASAWSRRRRSACRAGTTGPGGSATSGPKCPSAGPRATGPHVCT